jgi:hypothetical protein
MHSSWAPTQAPILRGHPNLPFQPLLLRVVEGAPTRSVSVFLPALAFFPTHADSSHTAPSSRRLQTSEGDASSPDSAAPHLNQLEGDATGPSTTGIEQSCPHRRRWPTVSGDTTGSSHPRDLHPSAFKMVICCHHIGFSHQRIDSGPLVCPHRISGSHRRR